MTAKQTLSIVLGSLARQQIVGGAPAGQARNLLESACHARKSADLFPSQRIYFPLKPPLNCSSVCLGSGRVAGAPNADNWAISQNPRPTTGPSIEFFFDKTLQPQGVAKSGAKVKRHAGCGHVHEAHATMRGSLMCIKPIVPA